MATALYAQDVHANNLANMDSVGYKPDLPSSRPREAVRQEDHLPFMPSDRLMERLGGGTLLNHNLIDFGQGSVRTTGNPLDLAIEGDGFFVVRGQHDANGDHVNLTRDGRFTRDAQGRLVSATSGSPVLDESNKPITLAPGVPVTIGFDGVVRQGQNTVARIKLVKVDNTAVLTKAGRSLFTAPANAVSSNIRAGGRIRQGGVEESSVNEIRSLLAVTNAGRQVEANATLIQQHDKLMERAINSLGRVA